MIEIMLENKTKPKRKTLGLTLNQALDILDYDKKGKLSSAADKRGAIGEFKMLLKKQYEEGVNLSDQEIKDLVVMYQSGWYHIREICEWFGLTNYEFKAYLKIAKEKGYGINTNER